MGFTTDSSGSIKDNAAIKRDVYSMESVVLELETQVNRLSDLELALNQRLAPVLRPDQSLDVLSKSYPTSSEISPMSPRAYAVIQNVNILREWINRVYELIDYVDA